CQVWGSSSDHVLF
nr:immunoglobulin light chain junction region [Macaca mulatta]MPN65792.1 immunoglobulin light chain junction region [Macaca mulatta]MPN65996.1 immunoglobulin light chain junction region [Macaca mulatta]MPN66193.1 immunoglobulin light chain junction region [Macaca mulatta]MPN66314.1 immunoglobulin light chain junction region [Macaca mulatta]